MRPFNPDTSISVFHPSFANRPELSGIIALLLERGAEDAFDRLTRLATMALRTSTAVLGLMSGARLLVKSQTGMPAPWPAGLGGVLPHAMYRHALATSRPFLVEDIKRHPLTKDMVLGPGWEHAAYCGVPIVLSTRKVVGVLAVFDPKPRPWTDREIGFLQDLADSAVREIEELIAPVAAPEIVADERLETLARWPDGFIALDAQQRIVVMNSAAEKLLRRQFKDVAATAARDAFPELKDTVFATELERAFDDEKGVAFEEYCRSARAWLEVRAFPAFDHVVMQLRDVSARRESEEALRYSEARYRAVFQDARDPIVFLSGNGSFVECNRAAANVLGYAREELLRIRLSDLFAEQQERERFTSDLEQFGALADFEAHLVAKDGTRLECAITVTRRRSAEDEPNGYYAIIENRTERNRATRQLLHGAFHDVLTALPNRALFMDRLERVIVQSKRRSNYRFAVLFVDLDRFKLVNDTLGHIAGDELLVAVARRLERCLRAEDTVARFGGDEFAILLDAIQDVRDATRIAERINFELALPFRVGRREVSCSASIGIALSATGYDRGEEVLRDADAAMYRAKAGGRARYEVFDTQMHARALAQLQLEKDLRQAVEAEQFAVFYQPVVSLDSGTITGIEALLRWRHPERGLLLPEEFIDMADQTGLIVPIGWTVMREACRQMRAWLDVLPRPNPDLTLGINLSARQFHQPDLVPRTQEILEETGLEARRLRLELTEQVVMGDPDLAVAMLGELQERGVRISIDNFGTGYSSIRHLHRLPVGAVKIDRSFITGLANNGDAGPAGVVQTIVALSTSLSIDAIAEGVETLEQLQQLRTLGARYAQGFLFSEPVEADAATELVLDRS